METLTQLASLIYLTNTYQEIDKLHVQFGIYGNEKGIWSEPYNVYLDNWLATTLLIPPKDYYGEPSKSLSQACQNLLNMLYKKGFKEINNINLDMIIPKNGQILSLITTIQSLLSELDKDWSLTIGYRYGLKAHGIPWMASISTSKWGRGSITRATGDSLHQVCQELWDKLEAMKDELPKMN